MSQPFLNCVAKVHQIISTTKHFTNYFSQKQQKTIKQNNKRATNAQKQAESVPPKSKHRQPQTCRQQNRHPGTTDILPKKIGQAQRPAQSIILLNQILFSNCDNSTTVQEALFVLLRLTVANYCLNLSTVSLENLGNSLSTSL